MAGTDQRKAGNNEEGLQRSVVRAAAVAAAPLGIGCGVSVMLGPLTIAYIVAVLFWVGGGPVGNNGAAMNGSAAVVTQEIGFALSQDASFTEADVTWIPPREATGFSFTGRQPENAGGPPPFVFRKVPAHQGTPESPDIRATYTISGVPDSLVDTMVVDASDGTREAWALVRRGEGTQGVFRRVQSALTAASPVRSKGSTDGWGWELYLYSHDDTWGLTAQQAQEFFDYLQSGDFFVGVRFPVPQERDSMAYRLPISMAEGQAPKVAVLDYTKPADQGQEIPRSVGTIELDFAPERQELLENVLPQKASTGWVALKGAGDPVDLADRFPLTAGRWEFYTKGAIAIEGMPDGCRDCPVDAFFCHEGTKAPPFFDGLLARAAGIGGGTFQAEGVTCLGPVALRLANPYSGGPVDPPIIFMDGPGGGWVQPPEQVKSLHVLRNAASSPITVRMEVASEAGLGWTVYEGDYEEPDFGKPVTGDLTLDGTTTYPLWLVADVPEGMEGPENATLTATSTTDPSKKAWTTVSLWIGGWVPPPATEYTVWVPVAVHQSGAHGSRWRTDLGVLNGSTAAVDVTITVYGADGEHTMTRSLAAGEQVILEDVVGQIPYTGAGAVKVSSMAPVVVTSRSYSQVADTAGCFPGGTLGQLLDSSDNLMVVRAGQMAWIPQLVESSRFRTNIAVTNIGTTEARATVTLYDGTGTALQSYDVTLAPGEFKQENQPFVKFAGVTELAAGYAKVAVSTGSVIGYASVIDNTTNDPTTLPLVPDAVKKTVWIPVGVHNKGAFGSRWRTDLGLLNGSSSAVDLTVTVYGSDGEHTLTRTLEAGEQVILADVVGQVPYTGAGAMKISATGPVVVTSRSYSQVADTAACFPGGTLGQFLDSSGNLLVVDAGQVAWIPHLVESSRFRTNIALTNVGATEARATVTLYDGTGAALQSYDMTLAPGEFQQENQPFVKFAGVTELAAGYAKVAVSEGSVIGYASVIDNTTNDPTTMPLVR